MSCWRFFLYNKWRYYYFSEVNNSTRCFFYLCLFQSHSRSEAVTGFISNNSSTSMSTLCGKEIIFVEYLSNIDRSECRKETKGIQRVYLVTSIFCNDLHIRIFSLTWRRVHELLRSKELALSPEDIYDNKKFTLEWRSVTSFGEFSRKCSFFCSVLLYVKLAILATGQRENLNLADIGICETGLNRIK